MKTEFSKRRFVIVAMMLIALLVLAACGGDEEEAAPAAEAPAATATFTAQPPTATPVPPTATLPPTNTPEPTAAATDSPLPTPDARGDVTSPVATPDARGIDSPLPTPLPTPEIDTGSNIDENMAALLDATKQLLVETQGLNPDELVLTTFDPMEWSDGSLGCPKPGELYAQVVTPGYLFVYTVGETEYPVHTTLDPEGFMVYCEGEEVEE